MKSKAKHPSWRPPGAGPEFAVRLVPAPRAPGASPVSPPQPRRRLPAPEELAAGVLRGDRALLARAITLIESDAPARVDQAQAVLARLLPHTGRSVRVGITGVPGAGKSSLIEALGTRLCGEGKKVAVLAV